MDVQILSFYLVVIVLPLLLGGILRSACRKVSKAWLITVISAILSAAAWMIARNPPVLGSELYWFRAIQAVCFTAGSLLAEAFLSQKIASHESGNCQGRLPDFDLLKDGLKKRRRTTPPAKGPKNSRQEWRPFDSLPLPQFHS